MEVNGEEERGSGRKDEETELYYSFLNTPCSFLQKAVQSILKCLGIESSSSSSSSSLTDEGDPGTETVEETGFVERITGLLRRRPKPPYSSGQPGQND